MIRRQLPAYSPLTLGSLARATVSSLTAPGRARDTLATYLRERFRCERVILTASGTGALETAMRMAREADGETRPVALPAYSCYDVATAAVGAEVPLRFYDLDPGSLAPDSASFRRVLASGAGAVVVANLYGFPVDWDLVRDACEDEGVTLIEDAAQGLGSSWRGREGGTFGDLTVLSFGRGKGWTGGGGGALLVREGRWNEAEGTEQSLSPPGRLAGVRAAALALAQWGLGRPALYALPTALPGLALGETVYRPPSPRKAISAYQAAQALATAQAARHEVSARRERTRRLLERLGPSGLHRTLRQIRPPEGGVSSHLRIPFLLEVEGGRLPALKRWAPLGLMPGYPRPLPELPAVVGLKDGPKEPFPGASCLSRSLITLPAHSRLTDRDLERLVGVLSTSIG